MGKDVRYDSFGKMTKMAMADGYVMARRPGAVPFVMPVKIWESLSLEPMSGSVKIPGPK